jgi:hypothetical protein
MNRDKTSIPVRREWHFDGEPRDYTDGRLTLKANAIVHAGPPVDGGLHVREVLPGDPSPEAVRLVADSLQSLMRTGFTPGLRAMQIWLNLLTGKPVV